MLGFRRMHDAGPPACGLVGRTVGTKGRPPAARRIHLPPRRQPHRFGGRPPNFVLVEVLLPHAKPAAEKEAFWAEFCAGVEARLPSIEPDIALRFVEMLGENVYFKRKAHAL